ncbi:MAG: winged helix-turn-helix transcriptional regulator [Lactobacillus sp.]
MAEDISRFDICPCAVTISLLDSKWKILILRELLQGPKRYGELKKGVVGVSQKMLTQSLKEMQADQLVDRKVYPEVPPHVEYSLSQLGQSLYPVAEALENWGIAFIKSSDPDYLAKRFNIHEPGKHWLRIPDRSEEEKSGKLDM